MGKSVCKGNTRWLWEWEETFIEYHNNDYILIHFQGFRLRPLRRRRKPPIIFLTFPFHGSFPFGLLKFFTLVRFIEFQHKKWGNVHHVDDKHSLCVCCLTFSTDRDIITFRLRYFRWFLCSFDDHSQITRIISFWFHWDSYRFSYKLLLGGFFNYFKCLIYIRFFYSYPIEIIDDRYSIIHKATTNR